MHVFGFEMAKNKSYSDDFEDFSTNQQEESTEDIKTFDDLALDSRILHAIASLGWNKPTLIQEKAIPLALEGYCILARARTGTGKTAAFSIPIVQNLLDDRQQSSRHLKALVLAPSKELCSQIFEHFRTITKYCTLEAPLIDLSQGSLEDKKAILISENHKIAISTPRKAIEYLTANILKLNHLKYFVIDESDLMFSFGYKDDLLRVVEHLPKAGLQNFLMSATLNTDVKELKKLVLNNPVTLKLEEPDLPESEKLLQYHIEVYEEEEKFVLINALFKLGLIIGKTIIFVSSVDRCYQLKLFLEQFNVRACVLNSELPIATRCHVVEQFNSDVYDIIIASDEKCVIDPSTRQKRNNKRSSEYGVSRGIDFKFVSNIINFDFPTSSDSYVHRVGRTARGNDDPEGTVLSFVSPKEVKYFKNVAKKFGKKDNFMPYQFKMEELEAFKYRAQDVLRAITAVAIREARLKEIKRELLASQALKSFFKEHPKDHKVLKHDRPLHTIKHQAHLADVPEYIVPQTLQTVVRSKKQNKRIEEAASLSYEPKRARKMRHRQIKKDNDPLKTFRFNTLRKNKRRKK